MTSHRTNQCSNLRFQRIFIQHPVSIFLKRSSQKRRNDNVDDTQTNLSLDSNIKSMRICFLYFVVKKKLRRPWFTKVRYQEPTHYIFLFPSLFKAVLFDFAKCECQMHLALALPRACSVSVATGQATGARETGTSDGLDVQSAFSAVNKLMFCTLYAIYAIIATRRKQSNLFLAGRGQGRIQD